MEGFLWGPALASTVQGSVLLSKKVNILSVDDTDAEQDSGEDSGQEGPGC